MNYSDFIAGKEHPSAHSGRRPEQCHPMLFPFQRELVEWAVRAGRAAIFADCGLGKTLMQLEWARMMGGRTLIVAPLAVADQTIAEGLRVNVPIRHVAAPTTDSGVEITNYEKLHRFVGAEYDNIVLDESSILESIDGKTRTLLLREFTHVPHRLCCTATPAPNDIAELANHAEFLGAMRRSEMLATFFVHDDEGWRIKGHAQRDFWRWVGTWGSFVRRPSDMGYDDAGFALPTLSVRDEIVNVAWRPVGRLFADIGSGVRGRLDARKHTVDARVARAAELIASDNRQWLVWCGLNAESTAMVEALGHDAVEIAGADGDATKIERERAWRRGDVRVLVTKPKIFGFGMNWQHCSRMLFLGIGDSYEQYYQSIRRCWRFGQIESVEAVIIVSDAETAIANNVRRKEADASQLAEGVIINMKDARTMTGRERSGDTATGEDWRLMLGDCVDRLKEVADDSVGLSVFSPPFAALYTYTADPRDMGNCRDHEAFFDHFAYLIADLQRVTMPGRRACVHVQQISTTQATHGVIGWVDFRAKVCQQFVNAGWIYDGEVVIDKDPQAQAIRTHSKALLFVQKNKDSNWCRPAMADYILLFRAPGENVQPVKTNVSNEEWILFARPVWYGIRESHTLNAAEARSDRDERHICPLQLETIERCVRLWSNHRDLILDPFTGIGSTGVVALQHDRRFVGIELKESYFQCASKNISRAKRQQDLFARSAT